MAEPFISEEAYLAAERLADTKNEYCDGVVFAMSGASFAHNTLSMNLALVLGSQLKGGSCRALPSDMRVKATGFFAYPDLSVYCGKPELEGPSHDVLLNPTLIAEVLSPSTEAYDRGKKFAHYRELTSLQEYLLVSQKEPRIERFRREGAFWVFSEAVGLDDEMDLDTPKCRLSLKEIYDGVPGL